jgi:hypothetical protein
VTSSTARSASSPCSSIRSQAALTLAVPAGAAAKYRFGPFKDDLFKTIWRGGGASSWSAKISAKEPNVEGRHLAALLRAVTPAMPVSRISP